MAEVEVAPSPAAGTPTAYTRVQRSAARRFFVTGAVLALLFAALEAFVPQETPPGAREVLVAALLAYGVAALWGMRAKPARFPAVMAGLALGAAALVSFTVVAHGWGIESPGLGLLGLITVMVGAVATRRLALVVGAWALATVWAVAWAHVEGLLWGAPHELAPGAALLKAAHWTLLVAGGVAGGWVLSARVRHDVAAASERERRFRGLLSIAADVYWEIDADYRLTAAMRPSSDGAALRALDADLLDRLPWNLPQLAMDAETQDLLRADLDARSGFRDLPMQWTDDQGRVIHLRVSGEPRLDRRGVFRGFWGVARDVTAHVAASEQLAATEGRYQGLFEHIPTPLVLHRKGRVVDANPAALALLGFDDLEALAGQDLTTFFESGDSRERARRRIEQVDAMEIGRALPVTDYRLRARDGRRVAVRATGVRVQAEGGPAVLAIFVDDTERRAAEDAVRRSEAMLSHLVATNPDVITLTEMATGRYAMVNPAFEQVTGYAAAEVVGRTSSEVGVWHRPEQRAEFVAQVQRHGSAREMPVLFAAKDGRVISMRVSGARFLMDRREYLVVTGRDVTAAERARLEREAILDTASIGIVLTREQRFVLANPRFERMLGWPPGALPGQPLRTIWGSDLDFAAVMTLVGPAKQRGSAVEFERRMTRRDGSTFLARVTASAIDPQRPAEGGTVWIVEDVTAQRQAEAALARARDEAEAANRAKSAFLANTSHELRTPLNGMIGLARLARDPQVGEEQRRRYLEQIGDSAQSLADIISDILDLSKIESGKLELHAEPFDLGALLHTLYAGYAMLAAGRGLALALEAGPDAEGHVRGDGLRVRQILSNYLGNALKFTARGGVRLVARRLEGELVRFEVHDTGPGIDAATQARLFRPFTQADDSTTRRFGGTGLGLSICRELATLMNGRVGLDSRAGEGSCFWAELPLPAAAPPPHAGALAPPELAGAHVLLVEDNPVNMTIAAAMLEQWGVVVEQAADGEQALAAVERALAEGRRHDAVLMDVQMPQMSGFEATRRLRARDDAKGLPIIALTAAALTSERDEALAAGMNDFLTKPIDAERLRAALGRWIAPRAAVAG
jgi:PAS domain S-box-containing protein